MPLRTIESSDLPSLVGQEVGVSDWFLMDQALIDAFAEVTGDRQWIHLDAGRCRAESPYGSTIAHGFLTLSLLSHLHASSVEIRGQQRVINYGLNRVRFPAPVPAGSRVRSHSTLQSMEAIAGGMQLNWLITVEMDGQTKPALVAEWLVRLHG